jgi:predicted Zn-dependent protease
MISKLVCFRSLSKTLPAIACLSTLMLTALIPSVEAKPAAQQPAGTTAIYDKAKKELPKDFYVLYRIVDRISRANQLDERPWRVGIVPEYDINAFATEVNLVAMYSGILDQLAGDSSALACVIGHEMGHNVKRHIALSKAQQASLLAQYQKEAEEEVNREVNSANTEATATSVAGGVVRNVFGGILGNVGGSVLQGASNRRIASARERVQQIVKKKQEELQKRVAETSRQQEFEADEVGYLYAARAGFEPEGCLRAMAVLARTPGAEFDTTHPAVPKRIETLKQLMTKYPAEKLTLEGKTKLGATRPLTYDFSKDGVSLRINSRFGGGSDTDLERLFGK